jgi:hypothetical protein
MKLLIALLMLSLCLPAAFAQGSNPEPVEATTAITLPVDSVTIYPDGLVSVRRIGTMDVTEGRHDFVVTVPDSASKDSVLLSVSNSTIERIVYGGNPLYTLNVSSTGVQKFVLSYLMYSAATWEPRYAIHLDNDTLQISANAVIQNTGGEDLKNIRLKLVAGLLPQTSIVEYPAAAPAAEANYRMADTVLEKSVSPAPMQSFNSQLETLFIFELPGRKDLEMNKEIGLPLFDGTVPLQRTYVWDASIYEDGPAIEEIRANNTMRLPWPTGQAQLYRDDEYVTTIQIPYTPNGTNASLNLGSSADLKVEKKLKDYNLSEQIQGVKSSDNSTGSIKVTTENSTYQLKVESNIDDRAALEINDIRPKEAKIVSISPKPSEVTATGLRWKLNILPHEKMTVEYTYQIVNTETVRTMVLAKQQQQ